MQNGTESSLDCGRPRFLVLPSSLGFFYPDIGSRVPKYLW
jgi:hypothetical protein